MKQHPYEQSLRMSFNACDKKNIIIISPISIGNPEPK